MTTCQVCGNLMNGVKDCGLNANGSINYDFCSNCYHNGNFARQQGIEEASPTAESLLFYNGIQNNINPATGENGIVLPAFLYNESDEEDMRR